MGSKMKDLIKDPIITMNFPLKKGVYTDRDMIVKEILEKKSEILETYKNNEYLKLDMTQGEIIGMKSTLKFGNIDIPDRVALSYMVSDSERYKSSKVIDLGNVNTIYEHI